MANNNPVSVALRYIIIGLMVGFAILAVIHWPQALPAAACAEVMLGIMLMLTFVDRVA